MDFQNSVTSIGGRCSGLVCSICAGFSPTAKQELSRLARIRSYRAGETVLGESEEIAFVGNVVSGVLRMQKTLYDGRQQIVGLLLPSAVFGRVFSHTSHVAIEAATNATLCCYNKRSFENLLGRFPELERRMLVAMSRELDAAHEWMLLLATQTVLERVTTFLLILNRQNAGSKAWAGCTTIEIPIARKDMAAYLGTTVESISRAIQQMARSGVIRVIGSQRLEVIDLDRLIALSGHNPEEFDPPDTRLRRAV